MATTPALPTPRALARALLAVASVGLVAAALPVIVRATSAQGYPQPDEGHLVVAEIAVEGALLAWDAIAGALLPACAVLVTAAWTKTPTYALGHLWRRIAMPYAVLSVALNLGMLVVVLGIVVAVAAMLLGDPVARAEREESGFVVPTPLRAVLMLALCGLWVSLAAGWMAIRTFAPYVLGAPIQLLAGFAWQLVGFGGWLAWCTVARRTTRPGIEAVDTYRPPS
jgi:hypothetical protein